MKKISVLIVDDSAVVRQVMTDLLSSSPDIDVMGSASDPIFAMEKMQKRWPDVIVLDVEMPRMDGISFLKQLMSERPTPVIICSTLTERGAKISLDALDAGAVTIVTKPKLGLKHFLTENAREMASAVREAAAANLSRFRSIASHKPQAGQGKPESKPHTTKSLLDTTDRVIAIGTSTGGTQALEYVLGRLPRVCPGIVVVQHMPEKFTAAFADRLNQVCGIEVKEASHNDRVIPGRALIAPGGKHMRLKLSGAQYYVSVESGPLVNRHIPSVDVLFRSVAKVAGHNAIGVIMTGMGDDGASGLLEMKQSGAHTLAQDEASCVVFGMPKEAIKRDAARNVVSLSHIPNELLKWSTV